jgi:hypothetical protein
MRMGHEDGQRVNEVRVDETVALNPALAAVARPFCLIMLQKPATGQDSGEAPLLKELAEGIMARL